MILRNCKVLYKALSNSVVKNFGLVICKKNKPLRLIRNGDWFYLRKSGSSSGPARSLRGKRLPNFGSYQNGGLFFVEKTCIRDDSQFILYWEGTNWCRKFARYYVIVCVSNLRSASLKGFQFPSPPKNTPQNWHGDGNSHLKMYFLLIMWISNCHVSFWECRFYNFYWATGFSCGKGGGHPKRKLPSLKLTAKAPWK